MKDQLDRAAVRRLGAALGQAGFEADACAGLDELELMDRVRHIAGALVRHLPGDYDEAGQIVLRAARALGTEHGLFILWPLPAWAALASDGAVEPAAALLAQLTPLATAEFAVRPLIERDPEAMRAVLAGWAESDDEHVRRLASEGTRPRLPWASRLAVGPDIAVPLLDRLREDPSEYVRRSVANHLNDLCYEDPALALRTAARWASEGGEHVGAVLRRGLRSLVRKGDPEALRLVGFDAQARVASASLRLSRERLRLGDEVELAVSLQGSGRVDVAYVLRDSGGRRRRFKLSEVSLEPGQTATLTRRHRFRELRSRPYKPGRYEVALLCNGAEVASATLELQPG